MLPDAEPQCGIISLVLRQAQGPDQGVSCDGRQIYLNSGFG